MTDTELRRARWTASGEEEGEGAVGREGEGGASVEGEGEKGEGREEEVPIGEGMLGTKVEVRDTLQRKVCRGYGDIYLGQSVSVN